MKLDLSEPRTRLLLAIAISIAIHEAAAGLVPQALRRPSPSAEVVTRAQIVRVAIRAVATPTPRPVRVAERVRTVAAAPAPRRAAAASRQVAQAPVHRAEPRRSVPRSPSQGRPVWDAAGSGNGHAGFALAGTGTNGSARAGAAGDAAAPASDTRPCGFVTFSDPHGSQFDSRTRGFWVDIRMAVRFSDGTTQSMILDYPWYYPSEAANPWSDANLRDPNFPTRFQQPPPEKAMGEPPLVQYVMAHSTADGLTLLRDCPALSPAAETP
ncbi:MAG TPA: hypothetical protein VMT95_06230 [Candidatus Binatia bacterium]|nr:hypothetical protein [Candidatus Binatia bacterium]